jgi:hypothetical protein
MHCTMPKFSIPLPHTNTLRAPLTKRLHANIYPHCVCTNQTPLRSANIMHTTRIIIISVHTTHTFLCICTPRNDKFTTRTYTPTFFHATPKFSARTSMSIFFCAVPKFSVHTSTPMFFCAVPKFSAHISMPILFCVAPNLHIKRFLLCIMHF